MCLVLIIGTMTAIEECDDLPKLLKDTVPKGASLMLPGTYMVDGIEVKIGMRWSQERDQPPHYQVDAFASMVLVGVRGGQVDDKGKAIKDLFSMKWWNRLLMPANAVMLAQGMYKLAGCITPQRIQDECYVCYKIIKDGTKSECGHEVCTRCFFKCVSQERNLNIPTFKCGVCRKQYLFTGEWVTHES